MFPASVKGAGMLFVFPDVCKIPPLAIPTPFPNTGMCADAIAPTCTMRVKITNKPVLHIGSIIASTTGDEPGSLLGVASGTVASTAAYTTASTTVVVEGSPIVTVLKMTAHNGPSANAPPGMQIVPSQPIVVIGT